MLFENTESTDVRGRPYWLATTGVLAYDDCAGFGIGDVSTFSGGRVEVRIADCFRSNDGDKSWGSYAVRPVVCLNSNVTINDIQKIDDQIEVKWENWMG